MLCTRRTYLLVIYSLATELFLHLLLWDTLVVYARILSHLQAVQLTGQGLEQSTAARAWTTQDDQHLSLTKETVEPVKNLLRLFLAEAEVVAKT